MMLPMNSSPQSFPVSRKKRDAKVQPVTQDLGAAGFFGQGVSLDDTPEALPETSLPAADGAASSMFGDDGWELVEAAQVVGGQAREAEAAEQVKEVFSTDAALAEELAEPLTRKAHREGRTTGSRFTVLRVSLLIIVLALLTGFILTRPAVIEIFAPKQVIVHQGTDLGVGSLGAASAD